MELEQLIPERVEWNPKITDENGTERELEFHFREFNLEDESYLKRTYGEKKLSEIFENMEMDIITRIAFRQLEIDSKRALMEITFKDLDEDGKDIEVALKGPEKLSYLIKGLNEQLDLIKMLLRTRGISNPLIEKLGETLVETQLKKAQGLD